MEEMEGDALVRGVGPYILNLTRSSHLLVFGEDLFFIYLLPPIIFNARFQVKKKQFFCNFITIMLFGAVGTLVSCTIISLGISNDLMEAIYSSANVLKRSTSIHWNKKQQSGFKSMKKKIQGATNEIRNVARIGHYTIPKEMNEVCNWLTARLGLEGYR
ncbi:hypothetical protein ES288_D07G137900v1 [Gossypium darwinii]|nr:hypothetical protein ES288_D07G137900v1 [Gossypium darwinii]